MTGQLGNPTQVVQVPAAAHVRAAVYVRVSSQEQAKGYSLDGQTKEVRSYCDAKGYRVVRLYRDVGSGRTLERDGYQLMIDAAQRGQFDVLVVWRRDRFGRDVVHNSVVERALQKAGVRIEAINTGPQEDTSESRLMAHLLDAFAEHEARTIALRCQLGRRESARKGIWPAKPPWGYKRNHETKGLEIDDQKAAVVRRVFELVATNWNTDKVAAATSLTRRRVEYMVRHAGYTGLLDYAGVQVPRAWPAIVPQDLFDKANQRIDATMHEMGRAGATRATKVGGPKARRGELELERDRAGVEA